jgi:hypothetical protein
VLSARSEEWGARKSGQARIDGKWEMEGTLRIIRAIEVPGLLVQASRLVVII